jgi:hypothetical protein
MMDDVLSGTYSSFIGELIPVQASLKKRRKDLKVVLREIKFGSSFFSSLTRYVGKFRERHLLRQMDVLPRITGAIAQDLKQKKERFGVLRSEQLDYLGVLHEKIMSLQPDDRRRGEYHELLQEIRSEDMDEGYRSLLARFLEVSDHHIHSDAREEALRDYTTYRSETAFHLIGSTYVYGHLTLLSDSLERKVVHLRHVLGLHREVIRLGNDITAARKGLVDVAKVGEHMYAAVGESYSRLEDVVRELRDPTHLVA